MNCSEARRSLLKLSRLTAEEIRNLEFQEARRHAENCPECQIVLAEEHAYEQQLSALVLNVPVPANLRAIIIQGLPVVKPSRQSVGSRSLRQKRVIITAALMLATSGICLPLLMRTLIPTQITLPDLMAFVDDNRSAYFPTTMPSRPLGWTMLPGLHESQPQHTLAKGAPVCIVSFSWKGRSATDESGRLWSMSTSHLSDAESLPDLSQADIEYRPKALALIWQESDRIYILEVDGTIASLHQIRDVLLRSRSIT